MKLGLFLVCALVLSGCTTVLYKEGATQADYQTDSSQCDYEVSLHTQGIDNSYKTMVGQELDLASRKKDLLLKCMRTKGWEPKNSNSLPKNNSNESKEADQILFQNSDSSIEKKVAYVNMQKAIQTSNNGIKAKRKLEEAFNKEKAFLETQKQKLSNSDYERLKASKQAEIQQMEKDLSEPIIKGLKKTISEIALKKGYTLVRHSAYMTDTYDLTEEVVEAYNNRSIESE